MEGVGVSHGWSNSNKKIKIVLPPHVEGQSHTIAFGSFGSFFTIHFTVSGW